MYHVKHHGVQQGPYTPAQIKRLLAEGQLVNDTPVCLQGTDDWQPLGSLPDFQKTTPPDTAEPYAPPASIFTEPPVRRGLKFVSNMAIASLAMGTLSIVVSITVIGAIILSIVSIIAGCLACTEIKLSRGRVTGTGVALGGIIAACTGIALAVCFAIAYKKLFNH